MLNAVDRQEKRVLRMGLKQVQKNWTTGRWQFPSDAEESARAQGFEGRFGYLLIEVWFGCDIMAWKGEEFRSPPEKPTRKQFFTYDANGLAEIDEATLNRLEATQNENIRPYRGIRVGIPSNLQYVYLLEYLYGGCEVGYIVRQNKGNLWLAEDPDGYCLRLM